MARKLKTDQQIDAFIAKIIVEANHHGQSVNDIIQPLSDLVRARINLSVDTVEVYERNGQIARTCWVRIANRRYVFSYNYQSEKIELKNGSTQGSVRFSFDNHTSPATLNQEVNQL